MSPDPRTRPVQPVSGTYEQLAEALFCTALQPSQHPSRATIAMAVARALTRLGGSHGCACEVAECYGADQLLACARMRWCLRTVTATYGPRAAA